MNDIKIIITGPSIINKQGILHKLTESDDNLTIMKHCTNDPEFINKESEYTYYLDTNSIMLSYKNNSFMTIITNNYISDGITIDEFYNNVVCELSPKQFNMISNSLLNLDNVIVIWLDSNKYNKISKDELEELKYLQEQLENAKYLYFLNVEDNEVVDIIIKYLNGDDTEKLNLLEQYS